MHPASPVCRRCQHDMTMRQRYARPRETLGTINPSPFSKNALEGQLPSHFEAGGEGRGWEKGLVFG